MCTCKGGFSGDGKTCSGMSNSHKTKIKKTWDVQKFRTEMTLDIVQTKNGNTTAEKEQVSYKTKSRCPCNQKNQLLFFFGFQNYVN